MKAIKIDVIKKDIYAIDIEHGIDAIYKALEIDTPFTVIELDRNQTLYLDDEGLLTNKPLGAFSIEGYPQVLSGHGLILGTDQEGDSEDTKMTVQQVKALVTFRDVAELPEPSFQVYPL